MKTISTLDQIRNASGKVYVRWSQSIKLDNGRGYSLRSGTSREAGLSCCEIDKTWSDWRILRQLGEYRFCGGYCWLVTGDRVGAGADNEPLLRNVKLIGKVSYNLWSTDWQRMKDEEEIADYRKRLTRITDPIGREIVEKALNRLLNK